MSTSDKWDVYHGFKTPTTYMQTRRAFHYRPCTSASSSLQTGGWAESDFSWVKTLTSGFSRSYKYSAHQTIPSPSSFPLLDHWIHPKRILHIKDRHFKMSFCLRVFLIPSPLPEGFISPDTLPQRDIFCLTEGCQYQLQYSANSTKAIFSIVTDPLEGGVSLLPTNLICCPTLPSKGSAI